MKQMEFGGDFKFNSDMCDSFQLCQDQLVLLITNFKVDDMIIYLC